jgi:hypothetical protein
VGYTWAHAIDEVSSDAGLFVFSRGNADFDVRQNLAAALSYNLPMLDAGPVLGSLLRDWSLDAILHAQSGQPVNLIGDFASRVDADGRQVHRGVDVIAGVPFYIHDSSVPGGRRFNGSAFTGVPSTRVGTFGRNVLRGLPLYQLDLALGRRFNLGERAKLQFKAEAFNVLNHPMFSGYNTSRLSPTFGAPTSTLNVGLGGLNSLYQLGGPRSIQLSARVSF